MHLLPPAPRLKGGQGFTIVLGHGVEIRIVLQSGFHHLFDIADRMGTHYDRGFLRLAQSSHGLFDGRDNRFIHPGLLIVLPLQGFAQTDQQPHIGVHLHEFGD